jgi:hypothetical protein
MIRFRNPPRILWRKGKMPEQKNGKDGHWYDKRGPTMLTAREHSKIIGTYLKGCPPLFKGWKHEHFKNDWRSQVPLGILAIMLWSGAFPNIEQAVDSLRPVLYVRWQ